MNRRAYVDGRVFTRFEGTLTALLGWKGGALYLRGEVHEGVKSWNGWLSTLDWRVVLLFLLERDASALRRVWSFHFKIVWVYRATDTAKSLDLSSLLLEPQSPLVATIASHAWLYSFSHASFKVRAAEW